MLRARLLLTGTCHTAGPRYHLAVAGYALEFRAHVGENGVDLPRLAARAADPHLVLHGVAATGAVLHRVGRPSAEYRRVAATTCSVEPTSMPRWFSDPPVRAATFLCDLRHTRAAQLSTTNVVSVEPDGGELPARVCQADVDMLASPAQRRGVAYPTPLSAQWILATTGTGGKRRWSGWRAPASLTICWPGCQALARCRARSVAHSSAPYSVQDRCSNGQGSRQHRPEHSTRMVATAAAPAACPLGYEPNLDGPVV